MFRIKEIALPPGNAEPQLGQRIGQLSPGWGLAFPGGKWLARLRARPFKGVSPLENPLHPAPKPDALPPGNAEPQLGQRIGQLSPSWGLAFPGIHSALK
jgi:hypothetical protein